MADFPYPPGCYDEKFHLRVSPLLWMSILWSIHPLLLLVLGAFSNSGQIAQAVGSYASNMPSMLSCLPGVLILFALMNRGPAAGSRVRWIWHKGRTLLGIGLCMQLATLLVLHWKELSGLEGTMLVSAAISIGLLLALLASRYSKDLFADFPSPEASGKD